MKTNAIKANTEHTDYRNFDNNVQYIYYGDLTPRKSCITAKEFGFFTKSIKEYGILDPIVLDSTGNVTDGNKRFYAAVSMGMIYIPCISEQTKHVPSYNHLLEDIADPSLHFFKKAAAISELSEKYLLTQEKIASLVGVSQSFVANKMRLLSFTDAQIKLIIEGELTERHARALLRIKSADKRTEAILYVIESGMNVSSAEKYIDDIIKGSSDHQNNDNGIPEGIKTTCSEIDKLTGTAKALGVFVKINRTEDARSINYTVKIYK